MTENSNLNEGQLTKVAGGKELEPQVRDEATYILEKCLFEAKFFFSEREDRYPEIKSLHKYIKDAYITSNNSLRKHGVELAIKSVDNLLGDPRFLKNPILVTLKDYLLHVQEIRDSKRKKENLKIKEGELNANSKKENKGKKN